MRAPWGLIFQVFLGASLSFADLGTDILAILLFREQERYSFALAIIAMISFTIFLHLVIISSRKKPMKAWTREALIVVSGLKPAFDAFRVVSSFTNRNHEQTVLGEDLLFEVSVTKIIESVGESIPSAVLQLYAVFSSPHPPSFNSKISIVCSILAIAYCCALICFDFDMDPAKRSHSPSFYGYIPRDRYSRFVVFVSMIFFSSCHIALKMIGVALFAVTSPLFLWCFLGGDMLLFLLLKVLRSDFRYWLKLDGAISWIMSALIRVVEKIMVDFTTLLDMRRTYEQTLIS